MKEELINKLYEKFEEDKEAIRKNLCETMDTVILQAYDDYGNVKLMIKYERNDEMWED